MATLGTLEYLISVNTGSVQSGLTNAESKFNKFGNKITSWAVAKGQVIGRLVEKAGTAVLGFVKGSVSESNAFSRAMSQVAATMGRSTESMAELSAFARKMGQTTAFSATEAAEALNYMALAGYDDQKAMAMLPKVLDLAAAGSMGLATASDMVTDASSALGLSIQQTETLVDQMAKTSSKSNTSVAQLGEAILTVGATAKMVKGGTTELNAVLGVLADNGIKGAEGGTALRNILLSLSAPTDKASKMIKKLGVEIFDQNGNMRELPNIFTDLNNAMKDMTAEQKVNILSEIFNKRDMASINALLGTTNKRWQELVKEITGSKNAAKEMAETQLDNLPGDITKFKSALGEAKLAITEGLSPTLRKFVQGGTELLTRITNGFKEGGLKGAVEAAKQALSELINGWKESDNPLLNTIGNALDKIREAFDWITKNKDAVITALTAIGAVWAGFKITGAVSNFLNLLQGTTAAATGADVGTSWGAAFSAKAIFALGPLVAFLATLGTPGNTKDNSIVDSEGNLTQESKDLGYTKDTDGNIADTNGFVYDSDGNLIRKLDKPVNRPVNVDEVVGVTEADKEALRQQRQKRLEQINKDRPALEEAAQMFGEATADTGSEAVGKLLADLAERYQKAFTDMEDEPVIDGLINNLSDETGNALSEMLEKISSGEDVDPAQAVKLANQINNQIQELLKTKPLEEQVEPKMDSGAQSALQAELDKYNLGVKVRPSFGEIILGGGFPHAKGGKIPYDNYPALLHRGEEVLTASQARKKGDTANNAVLVETLQELRNDFANMKLVVGKKTFGRAMVDYGGSRMGNFIGAAENRILSGYGE